MYVHLCRNWLLTANFWKEKLQTAPTLYDIIKIDYDIMF